MKFLYMWRNQNERTTQFINRLEVGIQGKKLEIIIKLGPQLANQFEHFFQHNFFFKLMIQ
jgi:hypothetical protein